MNEIPKEAQELLIQFQTYQQQFQGIMLQKETLSVQKLEISKALEELKKASDNEDVFKSVGPILIKTNKKDIEKELEEKQETTDLRLKTLEKQEKTFHTKIQELQNKLQETLATGKKAE